jgi:amidase
VGYLAAAGPMARTVDEVAAMLPVTAGPDWIDSCVQDVPLLDPRKIPVNGLRVAFHTTNGIMAARPDVAAVAASAAKALESAGAIIEEAIPPGIEQCVDIFMGFLTADGGEGLRTLLRMIGTTRTHPLMDAILAMSGEPKSAVFFEEIWDQLSVYRSTMLSFLKNHDVIVCPVNALPAVEHGTSLNSDIAPAFSYTIAHNLTGWPSAVVRCGTSDEGLPIGIQIVARPWREDVALAAAKHLETALGGYQRPPLVKVLASI